MFVAFYEIKTLSCNKLDPAVIGRKVWGKAHITLIYSLLF
jgi:hypothetical protein